MKQSLLSVIFISLIWQFKASAQLSIGFRTGGILNTSIYNTSPFQHTRNAKLGLEAGLSILYPITSNIAICSGLEFIEKNYKVNTPSANQHIRHSVLNNYLQVPLGISYSIGERKTRYHIEGGIYSAYWLSSIQKGKTFDILSATGTGNSIGADYFTLRSYKASIPFNRFYKRFEFGCYASVSIWITVSKALSIAPYIRTTYAFTDQVKKGQSSYTGGRNISYSTGIQLIKSFH